MEAIKKLRTLANEIDWYVYDNGGIPYDLRKIADEMEAENAKLRELIFDMLVDEERGSTEENTYYEHVRLAGELGIEVKQ